MAIAERIATVTWQNGVHARPSVSLVKLAKQYTSEVWLSTSAQMLANGKDIMSVMALAAPAGAEIRIVAIGADAEDAVIAIQQLIRADFDMCHWIDTDEGSINKSTGDTYGTVKRRRGHREGNRGGDGA
jgi:phosphocarrier protein HPr